jgi:hypothetical protein
MNRIIAFLLIKIFSPKGRYMGSHIIFYPDGTTHVVDWTKYARRKYAEDIYYRFPRKIWSQAKIFKWDSDGEETIMQWKRLKVD